MGVEEIKTSVPIDATLEEIKTKLDLVISDITEVKADLVIVKENTKKGEL